MMEKMTKKKKNNKILVFSQSPSCWKNTKTKKKKIQLLKEEDKEGKPNPGGGGGGGGGGGSTSTTLSSPGPHSQDRISELPVEILVHILGFLEMDEFLIRTSLVSTKWRNLWKSVSTLNFPNSVVVVDNGGGGGISRLVSTKWRNLLKSVSTLKFVPRCLANGGGGGGGGGGIRNNVEKYQNFVDHVLRLRDSQASKIRIFKYECKDSSSSRGGGEGGYDDYLERLHNFAVNAVVNHGAQEINIRSSAYSSSGQSSGNIIHFNPSIFTSGGGLLRKFTFAVYNDHRFLIQFPRSMCCSATQLTQLFLTGIRLPEGDDESNAQLHLVFPLLVILFMSNCYTEHLMVLDISAPRLKYLDIRNTCMRYEDFDGLGGCRIEIRTPNLISLVYEGDVYVDCFTENLPRLAFASLRFTKETGMVEQTTSFAIKLLKGITSAKSLTLAGFEDILQDTLKDLLEPFTSLRTLELVTNCNRSSIHGMVHFLNSCSSVEKLLLVWKEEDEFVEVEGDEHLMLPQCRLSHLKHVHIQRLRGYENEIELLKFLLKSSVVLEDLIIKATKKSPMKTIEENLKQFIEEEPSFRSIQLCVLRE